jgi:hypothetical protein
MDFLIKNILETEAQTLVNQVNCSGTDENGTDRELKKRSFEMRRDFDSRCQRHEIKPGAPYLFKDPLLSSRFLDYGLRSNPNGKPSQVVNFPIKNDAGAAPLISDIENGLKMLTKTYKEWGIESIAFPVLGNGKFHLEDILPLMYRYLLKWDIPVTVCVSYGTSIDLLKSLTNNSTVNKIDPASIAPVIVYPKVDAREMGEVLSKVFGK